MINFRMVLELRGGVSSAVSPAQTTDLSPEGDWDVIAKDFLDLATMLGS